jgi:predicted MPP superfamily phosphohydrolase
VYELIIWAFLLSVGAFLLVEKKKKVRSWKRRVIWWVLLAAGGVIFWGSFVEPRLLVVKTETVSLSSQPEHVLRAAVVSDMHMGPYKGKSWLARVVRAVNAEHPDIIFLVGDSVSTSPADVIALEPLRGLVAPRGVYGVLGNHDYEDGGVEFVAATLEELGVHLLRDDSVILEAGLRLAGVDDIWNGGSVYDALQEVRPTEPVVLLAHNPDAVMDPSVHLADLVVAGHTHSGQIRLPFFGAVPHIPDDLGRAYDKGLFVYNTQQLYITSGVGETGPRARLFAPPEFSMLTIEY